MATSRPDLDAIQKQVAAGYIATRRHPTAPYSIYNYTSKAQFEPYWTPETMACRGLILDDEGSIVSRPFQKFFTVEQSPVPIPAEPFEVFDKLDGSLGISYFIGDEPFIATRGSFDSSQAVRATEMLRRKAPRLDRRLTYLFEIIYPGNRVVIDYGETEDLFLLTTIETESGKEFGLVDCGFPTVRRYDGIGDFSALCEMQNDNAEGLVVRFESGLRVKIKFDEYKRLHRLLTGVTPRHIWEMLKEHKSLDPLLNRVPDEFYAWMRSIEAEIKQKYRAIESECERDFLARPAGATRKDLAQYFQARKYPAILFEMLDGKDYERMIWRLIKPEPSDVFKRDDF